MTEQEFVYNLEKYSPFRFMGSNERYVFMDGVVFIDDSSYGKYSVTSGQIGFGLAVASLSPFPPNVKVIFDNTFEEVTVNYDKRAIRTYPRNTRHPSAVDGFLIFKCSNIKERDINLR
ncbi:MAG: hypothetical protein A2066_09225 [Bacteroidetes bacterium GWB2_41_8]|nr:MAG: hypothetical protein A2066_09225 [Bacteroidetes bacterium GWB2_41_8]